jgi:hypothetical protein
MSYFYHVVPNKMIGHILTPLANLQTSKPELYNIEIKKYNDPPLRKLLPERIIKKLNCPQKEVLHFSPIHPRLMLKGLQSVFPNYSPDVHYFEIPISNIQNIPAIIFDMNCTGQYVFGEEEPEEMFSFVTPESYKVLQTIPVEAIQFYQRWKDRGEKGAPAMARIPHLMVKGSISIKGCNIINWND